MIKAYNLLGLMQRAGKLITGEDLITKNLKNNIVSYCRGLRYQYEKEINRQG